MANNQQQVKGKLNTLSIYSEPSSRTFLHLSEQLWKYDGRNDAPDSLDFCLNLPHTVMDEDGAEKFLPSSISKEQLLDLEFAILYSVTVTISVKGIGGLVKMRRR